MSADRGGYRGYISSRPVRDTRFPQRVQNLIIRTYAVKHRLPFKLSLAEYAMEDCYMMMETLLEELPKLDGLIVFSMFMLTSRRSDRERIYSRVIDSGTQLHAALEETIIRTWSDIPLFEDSIQVAGALRLAPMRGQFMKDHLAATGSDPFVTQFRLALSP